MYDVSPRVHNEGSRQGLACLVERVFQVMERMQGVELANQRRWSGQNFGSTQRNSAWISASQSMELVPNFTGLKIEVCSQELRRGGAIKREITQHVMTSSGSHLSPPRTQRGSDESGECYEAKSCGA